MTPEAQFLHERTLALCAILFDQRLTRNLVRSAYGERMVALLLEHDREKCEAVFGKDHAQTKRESGMTIRRKIIPL
ncbi:MAG: hypothetical protein F9K38_04095 [Pseudorhodoplanes sp.]|nr:MAG: hypothetical protein F9K38_04095 [Pseudorhodoplanes sp.]